MNWWILKNMMVLFYKGPIANKIFTPNQGRRIEEKKWINYLNFKGFIIETHRQAKIQYLWTRFGDL
jgi:hypothetical protein